MAALAMPSHPSPEQKASFFTKLQYLLTSGEFVSTYKYGLLLALTRWAVENPDHDDARPLDVAELALHFTALYWPHARPFRAPPDAWPAAVAEGGPGTGTASTSGLESLLVQERGGQSPRVLRLILEEQARGHLRLHEVPEERRRTLLREVRNTICEQPLWKLHNVGGSAGFRFLYQRAGRGRGFIQLEPGMLACLAAFAPLIEHVVRSAWLQFVLRSNAGVLGTASQIESFLFPENRTSLSRCRAVLLRLQEPICFYCGSRLQTTRCDVDHFLPWARYPRDLGHNFVLAHASCNGEKKDRLASVEHLERWCHRNDEHGPRMAAAFDDARLPHDWPTLKRAARSLYQIAEEAQAEVWRGGRELVPLHASWRALLGA